MADKNVIQSPAGEFVMFASEDGTVFASHVALRMKRSGYRKQP